MVNHFKLIFACTFITTSLYSMDMQKESEEEINIVRTCDLKTIRKKISREQLIHHTPAFSNAAMPCDNTLEIIEEFNKVISPQASPVQQTFAHYFNIHANKKTRSFTGSPFLDTLIQNGKLPK